MCFFLLIFENLISSLGKSHEPKIDFGDTSSVSGWMVKRKRGRKKRRKESGRYCACFRHIRNICGVGVHHVQDLSELKHFQIGVKQKRDFNTISNNLVDLYT